MTELYRHQYFCEPVPTNEGKLVATEVLTSFATPNGKLVFLIEAKNYMPVKIRSSLQVTGF